MPTVYGYARVSTDRQVSSGLSLQHQSECITDYYNQHLAQEYQFAGVTQEYRGISAFKLPFHKRPVGKQLVALLKAGDILLVDKPDRIFRTIRDCANTLHWLEKSGARLCMIDFLGTTVDQTSPMGKMMLNLMVMFAEMESQLKSRRCLDAQSVRRSQGKPSAVCKVGCDIDGEGRVFMPEHTIHQSKRVYSSVKAGSTLPQLVEILEEEFCVANDLKYRKSAFHKYHYKHALVQRLYQYGALLARGVTPATIANMTMKALKEACIGL